MHVAQRVFRIRGRLRTLKAGMYKCVNRSGGTGTGSEPPRQVFDAQRPTTCLKTNRAKNIIKK